MNSLTIMPTHEVAMPTTKQLRHINEDDEIIEKQVSNPNEIAYINYVTKYLYKFTWSQRAQLSGARTNKCDSMFIGYTKFGSHAWASVVKMPQGKVLYDAKDRVMI
ncbi:hypothetical protein K504DRAFT_505066 [Pleomassaria siparia CBS 279.74]|uniref:Uncharacterized protein n=1 Tax=Pleomassaria siparia CBS 279.74 TaxID=1314801 RepID=A0A6G1JZR3_9PLEO|nr:hypothetical protein K504DRAFT_505066 [Pleomassaria siparia CBS 279.74]